MRTVKDIMESKAKPFNIIDPQAKVIDALNLLNSVNLSYLIVKKGEEYKGIFSERDYARNVILKGKSSNTSTVQEVMTVDLPIVELSDTVEYCMNSMNANKARYLLAYERGVFIGVVTIHDILRQVIANREEVFDYNAASQLLDSEEGSLVY